MTSVEHLDLAAVLKVSRAVSSETDLDKLSATILRLSLEHAGADRGLLILSSGEAYRIKAEANTRSDGTLVELRQDRITSADLPESVFDNVLRTRETVLLQEASAATAFSDDEYMRRHRVRSVVCLPLLKQTQLVGAIYLENTVTSGALSAARMALLELLAAEAIISLENARLYRDLREREAKVRRLVDANIIGIFTWHTDGRVFEANEEFLRIVGYSRDDLVSGLLRWTDFTLPEWRERDARVMEELKEGGAAQAQERELLRKDGLRVPVLAGGTLFYGAPDEGVAFVIDLTERKRVETELRRAYDSFADAQRLSHTGSFITDLVGDDHNWSDEAFRIFDFEPGSKLSVQRIRDIIHPDDLTAFESVIARGMTGENVTFAFRIVTARGAVKQVRGVAHVVERVAGRPLFVGALQDVTESKVAEEALDRARSELARVARLTTVSALTASIAHEVNQPLSGIITNAATCLRMLAADPPDVDGARETARRTLRDGNRASDVITRLRALFSNREFTLEPLDMNEVTREVIALSLNDLQRNRIVLQSEFADELPMITGDRIQLQQVILNLLRNASDAMATVRDRPRQLLIRTTRDADDCVRVTVKDAGVGLDIESMNKLFDAFYTTKTDGMGIGLSVSLSIIERHHGRLWAEPNDGAGATFSFSIPPASESLADVAPARP